MSTKVGDWSVSYKNGKIVLRQTIIDKYALSLDDLPKNPADMVEEVVKRLQAIDAHGFTVTKGNKDNMVWHKPPTSEQKKIKPCQR